MNWSGKWDDAAGGLVAEIKGWDLAKPGSDKISAIINYNEGNITRQVMVEVIGDLGLEFDDGKGWCIYHLPTCNRFDKAVPGLHSGHCDMISDRPDDWHNEGKCSCNPIFEYDKPELLSWMAKVQSNYPTAWTMLRCLTPQDYADKGQSAKDILLEWCLSVKVE